MTTTKRPVLTHQQLVEVGLAAHQLARSTDLSFQQAFDTLGLVAMAAEAERDRIVRELDSLRRTYLFHARRLGSVTGFDHAEAVKAAIERIDRG